MGYSSLHSLPLIGREAFVSTSLLQESTVDGGMERKTVRNQSDFKSMNDLDSVSVKDHQRSNFLQLFFADITHDSISRSANSSQSAGFYKTASLLVLCKVRVNVLRPGYCQLQMVTKQSKTPTVGTWDTKQTGECNALFWLCIGLDSVCARLVWLCRTSRKRVARKSSFHICCSVLRTPLATTVRQSSPHGDSQNMSAYD